MPTNTFVKPAATINARNSASSARFTDASVRKPIFGCVRSPPGDHLVQQLPRPGLVPDEIVVHEEHHVLPAPRPQRLQLGDHLGRRFRPRHAPFITMMSQNSQSNGHPRENCTAIVT